MQQLLVQPGENFYVAAIKEATTTVIVRIADPHTGAPLAGVTAGNPIFDLLKEAYFRKLTVEVGYRDLS